MSPILHQAFFARDVVVVARDLIGGRLLVDGVGDDCRDRGLRRCRSCFAQLWRSDGSQRLDVRPCRTCLRLSVLRHPLVLELCLPFAAAGQRRAHPSPRANQRAGTDAGAARQRRPPPALCRTRPPLPGPGLDRRAGRLGSGRTSVHHRVTTGPAGDRRWTSDRPYARWGHALAVRLARLALPEPPVCPPLLTDAGQG